MKSKASLQHYIKQFFKKNQFVFAAASWLIYLYLRIVYLTSSWCFTYEKGYSKEEFKTINGAVFALWHNKLAFGPGIFKNKNNTSALVSPHSDGKIISGIISKFAFGIIEGSTNKNSLGALRTIIKLLSQGDNIVITPDGPRGPVYKINSSITAIAKKYNAPLIPVSCFSTKYFTLKSWDKLIMPLPFGKITVTIGNPITLSEDQAQNDLLLERHLMSMESKVFS